MSKLSALFGNATRSIELMFPEYYQADTKHNHYRDFGYPTEVAFEHLYQMFVRNGLAQAAVQKTAGKSWESMPQFWETMDQNETTLEAQFRQRLDDIRFWGHVVEADRRSLVGRYGALILRIGDDRRMSEPAGMVRNGVEGLVEVIPCWERQIEPQEWDQDEMSPTYGHPTMYVFNEAFGNAGRTFKRTFSVHHSRVVVFSSDGTVGGRSLLEPGFNDLLTMEKVSGAGGEGFWKNAKAAPILTVDKETRLKDMAAAMNVTEDKIVEAMNEQVGDWQQGFDKLLMLQGIKAEALNIMLPQPEQFFNIALQSFAASINIPLKILVGNQTGERASTEDAADWSRTNNARRGTRLTPILRDMLRKLEAANILPERDWYVRWDDLLSDTPTDLYARAKVMSEINTGMAATGELVYLPEEIRALTDHEPLDEAEKFKLDMTGDSLALPAEEF